MYNAGATIDYNDLDSAQTAGLGIALSVANIVKLFTVTQRKLTANNVPQENRFMVVSSEVYEVLVTFLAGKESVLGDRSGESGHVGRYMGIDIYVSNNLTGYIRWTPTDNPASGETLVVNGVTFTFIDTIGTTAGNVLQTTSTAVTIDNLVDLINNNTTTANHVAFTGEDKDTVETSFFAVDGTTYIDIYVKGASYITSTDTADATYTYKKQLCLAGEKKAIDLVIQTEPRVKMASAVVNGQDGMKVLARDLYGVKVFHDMANRLFSIEVDSSSY